MAVALSPPLPLASLRKGVCKSRPLPTIAVGAVQLTRVVVARIRCRVEVGRRHRRVAPSRLCLRCHVVARLRRGDVVVCMRLVGVVPPGRIGPVRR